MVTREELSVEDIKKLLRAKRAMGKIHSNAIYDKVEIIAAASSSSILEVLKANRNKVDDLVNAKSVDIILGLVASRLKDGKPISLLSEDDVDVIVTELGSYLKESNSRNSSLGASLGGSYDDFLLDKLPEIVRISMRALKFSASSYEGESDWLDCVIQLANKHKTNPLEYLASKNADKEITVLLYPAKQDFLDFRSGVVAGMLSFQDIKRDIIDPMFVMLKGEFHDDSLDAFMESEMSKLAPIFENVNMAIKKAEIIYYQELADEYYGS